MTVHENETKWLCNMAETIWRKQNEMTRYEMTVHANEINDSV